MDFEKYKEEKIITLMLSKGKDEREKSQYYSEKENKIIILKASKFLEEIAEPYIKLMEKMIEDDA